MQDDTTSGLSWSKPQEAAPASVPEKAPAPATQKTAQQATPLTHTQIPLYAGFLVGGMLLGVLITTGWSSSRDATPSTAATTTQAAPAHSTTTATNAVSKAPLAVRDQAAGSSVAIDSLNIARPTWVVVYVSRNGRPGNALGARLFFAGDTRGAVALLRNTEAGQRYFVGLSVDNGDRSFSLTKDLPLADADGGPLWVTFTAR